MNTELKYRTFDELLDEVSVDFKVYSNEGMIEPGELIKVAQRVTYDLGLRIHKTKEVILDVEKRRAKLPDDFYVVNYAMLIGRYKISTPAIQGDQRESVCVASVCRKCHGNSNECGCDDLYSVAVDVHGDDSGSLVLVQKIKSETRVYDHFERIHLGGGKYLQNDELHGDRPCPNNGEIKNGYIYTNLQEGKIYLSYEGALEDDEGNLLVLDHPMINEYYEYALKQRILENLFMSGEEVSQKMQLIETRLRAARNYALTIVNTPNFSEMKKLWEMNRRAQYNKYYDMFKSGPQF
jgi:hypothetical protein